MKYMIHKHKSCNMKGNMIKRELNVFKELLIFVFGFGLCIEIENRVICLWIFLIM